jgi:hypothetical protein
VGLVLLSLPLKKLRLLRLLSLPLPSVAVAVWLGRLMSPRYQMMHGLPSFTDTGLPVRRPPHPVAFCFYVCCFAVRNSLSPLMRLHLRFCF